MGDKEKLVKTIADTLRKQLTIDTPPQRVTRSSSLRKTRSRSTDATYPVKVLFSVKEGEQRVFYVGGDRLTPTRIFSIPWAYKVFAFLQNAGKNQNDWLFSCHYYSNDGSETTGTPPSISVIQTLGLQNWKLEDAPLFLHHIGGGFWTAFYIFTPLSFGGLNFHDTPEAINHLKYRRIESRFNMSGSLTHDINNLSQGYQQNTTINVNVFNGLKEELTGIFSATFFAGRTSYAISATTRINHDIIKENKPYPLIPNYISANKLLTYFYENNLYGGGYFIANPYPTFRINKEKEEATNYRNSSFFPANLFKDKAIQIHGLFSLLFYLDAETLKEVLKQQKIQVASYDNQSKTYKNPKDKQVKIYNLKDNLEELQIHAISGID